MLFIGNLDGNELGVYIETKMINLRVKWKCGDDVDA
jgi:hypothetical protein